MSRKTRTSAVSSRGSDRPLLLEPERSRLLGAWWLGVHAVAAAGIVASGLPLAVKLAGLAAATMHGSLRRPAPPPAVLVRYPDGSWVVPAHGPARFVLAEGTAAGPFWILLRLAGGSEPAGRSGPRKIAVLLMRDQLSDAQWRSLRAAIGRARPAAHG